MKKTLILLFLAVTLITSSHADPFAPVDRSKNSTRQEFRVSKVGKDKSELIKIFDAVNELKEGGDSINRGVKVVYRISSTEFLVYPKRWKNVTWGGSSNRLGMGGNTNTHRSLVVDRTKLYFLTTNSPLDLVTGESSSDIITYETGEIKDKHDNEALAGYGGVRVLKEAASLPAITKEDFVARLKLGESWTLPNYKTVDCRKCMGRGDMGKLRGNAKCTDCRATGKAPVDYIVVW